jgi:hypothetical protein
MESAISQAAGRPRERPRDLMQSARLRRTPRIAVRHGARSLGAALIPTAAQRRTTLPSAASPCSCGGRHDRRSAAAGRLVAGDDRKPAPRLASQPGLACRQRPAAATEIAVSRDGSHICKGPRAADPPIRTMAGPGSRAAHRGCNDRNSSLPTDHSIGLLSPWYRSWHADLDVADEDCYPAHIKWHKLVSTAWIVC